MSFLNTHVAYEFVFIRVKKRELGDSNIREANVFVCYPDEEMAMEIARHGLTCRRSPFNFIGMSLPLFMHDHLHSDQVTGLSVKALMEIGSNVLFRSISSLKWGECAFVEKIPL